MTAVDVRPMATIAPNADVARAATSPCGACPWRTANHGRRHPDGWYTKANVRRLWSGMRRGEMMTCHPTDPRNPVPAGQKPAPANAVTRECAGAHLLIQREMQLIEGLAKVAPEGQGWAIYRRRRPRGLTREGLLGYLERVMFGGQHPVISGGVNAPTAQDVDLPCSINDPDALPWPTTPEELL